MAEPASASLLRANATQPMKLPRVIMRVSFCLVAACLGLLVVEGCAGLGALLASRFVAVSRRRD
eukprot:4880514-Prymnesium_polylepis.1